ncbi:MAG: hypothetical protein A2355_15610 [Spirochaetes bacterium RIFOXYB1_FULL_32_8]|nr:MAG: hypothetical protein A2355_15610 [Spirochaetes bacterium RIFOXYB1_FULL_32_8]
MIYIVHGEDASKSRQLILNQLSKLNAASKTDLSISATSPQKLAESLSGITIFGDEPFVVFDVSGAGRKNVDDYIEVIKRVQTEFTLIIFSNKKLTKSNAFIKAFADNEAKVVTNEKTAESNIFNFLDALAEKDRKSTYSELSKLLSDDQDEIYILTMIQYLVRNLSYFVFNSSKTASINPYVKYKLVKQSKKYTEQNIKDLYSEMYMREKQLKTGEIEPQTGLSLAVEKMINSC